MQPSSCYESTSAALRHIRYSPVPLPALELTQCRLSYQRHLLKELYVSAAL